MSQLHTLRTYWPDPSGDPIDPNAQIPVAAFTSESAFDPNFDGAAIWNRLETGGTEYPIDTRYEWDYGLHVMPVAGPSGTPPRIMRLHAGFMTKTADWSFERMGACPTLPSSDTGNPDDVIAYKTIVPQSPNLGPDGVGAAWRVSGTYVYINAIGLSDSINLNPGAPPYATWSTNDNMIMPGQFSNLILQTPPGG